MMCIKKLVEANKLMTVILLSLAGLALGYASARILIDRCCCAKKLCSRAKRAFKAIEEKMTW